MEQPAFTTRDQRDTQFFRLLKESLDEKPESVPDNLTFLRAGLDGLDYEQIGEEDGFLNYIYRIKEKSPGRRTVVAKWTRMVPRIAEQEELVIDVNAAGGGANLQEHDILERNTLESKFLKKMESIVAGSTPKVYFVDPKRYFFIMEDLADYTVFRHQLVDGVVSEEVFRNISKLLSALHKATHIHTLGKEKFQQLQEEIGKLKTQMLAQAAEHFFETGFKRKNEVFTAKKEREFSEGMEKLLPEMYDNSKTFAALKPLKESFLHTERCLLHNDSHPGAFMVQSETAEVRMLDLELASMGNPAKEIGYGLGEVVMFYYIYQGRGKPELARKLRDVTGIYIRDYLDRMGECVPDVAEFMRYAAGHAAQFGMMRTANTVLAFPQFAGLERAEVDCLQALIRLLRGMDDITSVDAFLAHAFS